MTADNNTTTAYNNIMTNNTTETTMTDNTMPAINNTVTDNTTEAAMTNNTVPADNNPAPANPMGSAMEQMAAALIQILKPQLKELISEEVDRRIKEFADLELEEKIEEALDIDDLAHRVYDTIDFSDAFDTPEFTSAVEDVVSEMEVSVTIGGRGRRW